MKEFAIGIKTKIASWLIALVIIVLNIKLAIEEIQNWINSSHPNIILSSIVIIICLAITCLLIYIIFAPFAKAILPTRELLTPHTAITAKELKIEASVSYNKIAVAVDFSEMDKTTLEHAINQGGKDASYILVHIVETATARYLNAETFNYETISDKDMLDKYVHAITDQGYKCDYKIGYGNPINAITNIIKHENADLLIMGAHGHKLVKDLLLGSTIDTLRHRLNIPILIVTKNNEQR